MPAAGEIGPVPMETVPVAFADGQAQWLRELAGQDWVLAIRADGQRNLLAIARTVAVWADWDTLESRPTWEELIQASGLSARSVARWLLELRLRGWLELIEHGSTPSTRPMSLAALEGNRAAVYGLRLPLTPERAAEAAAELLLTELATDLTDLTRSGAAAQRPYDQGPSTGATQPADQLELASVDVNVTPSWSCRSLEERSTNGFSRARKSVDKSSNQVSDQEKQQMTALRAGSEEQRVPDLLIMVPVSRYEQLVCADALRRAHLLFGRCSRKLVRSLCRRFWRAGWCGRDILHALDHRPSMFVQVRRLSAPEHVVSPRQFIASRLAAWRTEDGGVRPGWWTTRTRHATQATAPGPGNPAAHARALVRARHGRAGERLLRAGEHTLTAERVAAHGRAVREPARAADVPARQDRAARARFQAELIRTAHTELARRHATTTEDARIEGTAAGMPPTAPGAVGGAGNVYARAVARARAEGHLPLPRRRGRRRT